MKYWEMQKFFLGMATLLSVCAAPQLAQADVYKHVDKHGQVYYTDKPKNSKFKRVVKTKKRRPKPVGRLARRGNKYSNIIAAAARKHNVDPSLLHAVIKAESAYNAKAISRAGAVGLMQLMPQTAKRYGVEDRENPDQNIHGGTRYLRDLLDLFKSDTRLAVAAYNAGENAVMRYGNKIPPYPETQQYVVKVMNFYERLKQ